MQKTNGITLIELLIILVIIVILIAMAFSAFGPRNAGAAELSPLETVLNKQDVNRLWYPRTHSLVIYRSHSTPWTTATEACSSLQQYGVKHVIISDASSSTESSQLYWEKGDGSRRLTKPFGNSEAHCT